MVRTQAAACAIELIYMMQLLKFIHYECEETVCVETDNKGAHDLCHRVSLARSTRVTSIASCGRCAALGWYPWSFLDRRVLRTASAPHAVDRPGATRLFRRCS